MRSLPFYFDIFESFRLAQVNECPVVIDGTAGCLPPRAVIIVDYSGAVAF